MKSYKNRVLDYTKPVLVYRNLTKSCYSIRQDGKVIGHADNLTLWNCDFIVRKSGQKRVRETKEKNVHAFVQGFYTEKVFVLSGAKVSYNPYKMDTFMANGQPIEKAEAVYLHEKGVFAGEGVM